MDCTNRATRVLDCVSRESRTAFEVSVYTTCLTRRNDYTPRTWSFACRGGNRSTPSKCVSACREGRGCTVRRSFSPCREDTRCILRCRFSTCRGGTGCTPRIWLCVYRGDTVCVPSQSTENTTAHTPRAALASSPTLCRWLCDETGKSPSAFALPRKRKLPKYFEARHC